MPIFQKWRAFLPHYLSDLKSWYWALPLLEVNFRGKRRYAFVSVIFTIVFLVNWWAKVLKEWTLLLPPSLSLWRKALGLGMLSHSSQELWVKVNDFVFRSMANTKTFLRFTKNFPKIFRPNIFHEVFKKRFPDVLCEFRDILSSFRKLFAKAFKKLFPEVFCQFSIFFVKFPKAFWQAFCQS